MRTGAFLLAASLLVVVAACSKDTADTADAAAPPDTIAARRDIPSVDTARPAAQAGLIWQGTSDGYTIKWGANDITVVAGGSSGAGFSLRDVLLHRLKMSLDTLGDQDYLATCTNETTVKLLSVVGSIISIERADYTACPGAAHPGAETRYEAFGFANPDRKLTLAHFFNEEDIYQALLGDPLVRKTLDADGITDMDLPASLSEFVELLSKASRECEYEFSDDLLSRFAFHHIDNGKVAVRLGLSHGAGACRGTLTQIGILLPMPLALKDELTAASSRKAGYLMRDLKSVSNSRTTTFVLK